MLMSTLIGQIKYAETEFELCLLKMNDPELLQVILDDKIKKFSKNYDFLT